MLTTFITPLTGRIGLLDAHPAGGWIRLMMVKEAAKAFDSSFGMIIVFSTTLELLDGIMVLPMARSDA